jgi:uncharacterized protein YueI
MELLKILIGAIGGCLFALVLKAIFIKNNSIPFAGKIKLIKHVLFKSENVIYIELSNADLQRFLSDRGYNFDVMTNLHRYCEMQIIKEIANSLNENEIVLEKALFEAKVEEKSKEVTND